MKKLLLKFQLSLSMFRVYVIYIYRHNVLKKKKIKKNTRKMENEKINLIILFHKNSQNIRNEILKLEN